jgi:hypothetical protein
MILDYFTQPNIQMGIILAILGAGLLCLVSGILVLLFRGFTKEMRVLAGTSTELSKRAISHDMTALASSVSEILDLINQMMKTAAGVGAFLILVGVAMMAVAYLLTSNLS